VVGLSKTTKMLSKRSLRETIRKLPKRNGSIGH